MDKLKQPETKRILITKSYFRYNTNGIKRLKSIFLEL